MHIVYLLIQPISSHCMSYPRRLSSMARTRLLHSSELRSAESRVQELQAESLDDALPEGFSVNGTEKEPEEAPQRPALAITVLNIVNGAIWGVLARKGVMVLTTYDGSYLGGVVWANFGACLVMGAAVELNYVWQLLLGDTFGQKGTIPLYVGITTGFCGTFSSFSSFILEAFEKASNTLAAVYGYPNAAYGIMEALAVIFTQLAVSALGFHVGKHLMGAADERTTQFTAGTYRILEYGSSILGVAAYVVVIVLTATKSDGTWRSWMFLCLFAPWGALLRFYLLKKLNTKVRNFPLGTFAANTIGCLLLAIFTLLLRGKSGSVALLSKKTACHVLVGLDDGFCGALTTVSTFIAELFGLATLYGYRYCTASVTTGFVLMVLILGSYNWAVGLGPACAT